MGNHIHLLIRNGEEVSIGEIFRHIGSAFVYWYNLKYERSGHLFQDRYKSEPVNDEAYLLTVLRYILMNPVKAGICYKADGYSYSSAREYLLGKPGITDTAFILRLISKRGLKEYLNRQNDDCCLEIDDSLRRGLTDDAAKKIILREFQNLSPSVVSAKDRTALNTSICKLLRAGISIRQLSRLTGISKKIIEKAKE